MAKLTEDMVVARTRASDLSAIKKLNCWGGELQDISLLRRMNNVEVLSLSVNKISSLADVQYCKNLRELYVRKNDIKNLNEICYLRNLPHLKALWLGENPCSVSDALYRMTVIKNLPTLEKLDDVKIEPEERQDSMKKGKDLIHPEDYDYETSSPTQSPVRASRSPPASGRSSDQDYEDSNESRKSYSPEYDQQPYITQESRFSQPNDRYDNRNYKTVRRPSETAYDVSGRPTPESQKNVEPPYDNGVVSESVINEKQIDSYLNRCNSDTTIVYKKEKSMSETNMKMTHNATNQEDSEGDCGGDTKEGYCNCTSHHYERRSQVNTSRSRERGEGTRCSSSEGSGRASPQKGVSRDELEFASSHERAFERERIRLHGLRRLREKQERAYRQYDNYRIEGERFSKGSPYPPRRPVTRNSNLLSAVLCLIKELDYPSLEVVAIAVRCRMDEFDD